MYWPYVYSEPLVHFSIIVLKRTGNFMKEYSLLSAWLIKFKIWLIAGQAFYSIISHIVLYSLWYGSVNWICGPLLFVSLSVLLHERTSVNGRLTVISPFSAKACGVLYNYIDKRRKRKCGDSWAAYWKDLFHVYVNIMSANFEPSDQ